MPNESYGFFAGTAPYHPFHNLGDHITGTISAEPFTRQQTDPVTNEPKVWKSGEPQLVLVIPLQTTLRDPEIGDDDGERTIWVSSQGMRQAIGAAVKKAGRKGLDVGGQLTLQYTGDGERTNPALSPPKLFAASYTPPANAASAQFLGADNGIAGQPAPIPAQQQAVAPPPGWQQQPEWKDPFTYENVGGKRQAPPPANLPPGMTPEVWATLSPEAQAALSGMAGR